MFTFVLFSLLTACSPKDTAIAPQALESADLTTSVMSTNQLANVVIDSNATLKSVASFPVGAAPASWLPYKSQKGLKFLGDQFSSKTVHAYMNIETSRGKYDFSEPDYWIKWAESHPVRLHGHCLVYHEAAPNWLLNYTGTTSDFEQIIKEHIQTVVSRYKGKIKSWDVINEIFVDKTGSIAQTPFRKLYTSDNAYLEFVKRCFQWAHEADPNALLFYNEGSYENEPAKLNSIIQLVNDFKRNGVPIDGLGSQMHININTSNNGIRNSLQQLASTGLLVHISELDIKINPDNLSDLVFTNQLFQTQSEKFQLVASYYKQLIPKQQQYGITVWDLSDADSWIVVLRKRHDAPCLFNTSYDKKPSFYGFMRGLQ